MPTHSHGVGSAAQPRAGFPGPRPGRLSALLLALLLALCPLRLPAEVIRYHFTINATDMNWTQAFTVDQYDQAASLEGLSLQRIEFVLQGTITGSIGVENLDPVLAQSLSLSYSSTLTLTTIRPDATTLELTQTFPTYTHTQELAPYDNTQDYLGASGETLTVSTTSTTTTSVTAPPEDLALFAGTGTIMLPLAALEALVISGESGKMPVGYGSMGGLAGADLWVIYHTPEPGSLLLLGCGAMVVLCRRSRRQSALPVA